MAARRRPVKPDVGGWRPTPACSGEMKGGSWQCKNNKCRNLENEKQKPEEETLSWQPVDFS
jgi:hypothetical protein